MCLTGQNIPKVVCENLIVSASARTRMTEKGESHSIEPLIVWHSMVIFLSILFLVILLLCFCRRNPSKHECSYVIHKVKMDVGDSASTEYDL